MLYKRCLDNQNRIEHNFEEKEMKTKIYFHVKGSKVLSNLFFYVDVLKGMICKHRKASVFEKDVSSIL